MSLVSTLLHFGNTLTFLLVSGTDDATPGHKFVLQLSKVLISPPYAMSGWSNISNRYNLTCLGCLSPALYLLP